MAGVLRLTNFGERTFYVYKDGKVVPAWDKMIKPNFNDILEIYGENILLHGVLGALTSVRPVQICVANLATKIVVDNKQLDTANHPGSFKFYDQLGLLFWIASK